MDGDAGPGDGREASCIGRLVGVDEEGACVEGAEEGGSRVSEEKDLFFHSSEVQVAEFNDLREGETVSFEVEDGGEKGPRAIQVTRV